MASSDLFNELYCTLGFAPVVLTNSDTAQATGIIDMQGYDSILFVVLTGTLTDANATFTASLAAGNAVDSESSPTSITDSAAVTDANELLGTLAAGGGSFTFAEDLKAIKLGYRGSKRWVKFTLTPSGNDSGAAPLACLVIRGHAALLPKSTQQA